MPTTAKSHAVAVAVCTDSGAELLTADSGAKNWRKSGPMLGGESVNSMIFDSKQGRLYATTHTEGVFVSDNLGKKWTRHGFPMVISENGRRRAYTVPAYQGPGNRAAQSTTPA